MHINNLKPRSSIIHGTERCNNDRFTWLTEGLTIHVPGSFFYNRVWTTVSPAQCPSIYIFSAGGLHGKLRTSVRFYILVSIYTCNFFSLLVNTRSQLYGFIAIRISLYGSLYKVGFSGHKCTYVQIISSIWRCGDCRWLYFCISINV